MNRNDPILNQKVFQDIAMGKTLLIRFDYLFSHLFILFLIKNIIIPFCALSLSFSIPSCAPELTFDSQTLFLELLLLVYIYKA